MTLGNETFLVQNGEYIFASRGIPHTFMVKPRAPTPEFLKARTSIQKYNITYQGLNL
ncbi:hypothetical protein [Paenibacillus sp. R14(2021)]|uniref:hypothetical protein n=1 Tax=Paenibacillus sp. R14(2021) TaxID=2859228 RepID=UPI001C6132C8